MLLSCLWGVLLFFLLLVAVYCGLVLYWEKHGVPEKVLGAVERSFLAFDLKVKLGKTKALFPFGFETEDFSLAPVFPGTFPEVHAGRLRAEYSAKKLLRGVLFPFRLKLKKGRAVLPLFPELPGNEGAEDVIELTSFSLDVRWEKGLLRVTDFQGEGRGGRFAFHGTVNNFLHSVAASFGHTLTEFLWEKEPHEKENLYVTWMRTIPSDLRGHLAVFSRALRQEEGTGNVLPFTWKTAGDKVFLKAAFRADLYDFKACRMTAALFLPESRIGNVFTLKKHVRFFRLADGILEGKNSVVELGGKEKECSFSWEGAYDTERKLFRGKTQGKLPVSKLLPFLPEKWRNMLKENLAGLEKEKIGFSGTLERYQVGSGIYDARIEISLPETVLKGIRLSGSPLHIRMTPEGIRGEVKDLFFAPETEGKTDGKKGKLSFAFQGTNQKITGSFSGEMPFAFFEKSPLFSDLEIRRSGKENLISFSGEAGTENLSGGAPSGKIRFRFPEFSALGGVSVRNLAGRLGFTTESISVESLEGTLEDSLKFSCSGNIRCPDRKMSLSLHSGGSPEKTLKKLSPRYRKKLETLLNEISWPKEGALADLFAKVYVDYGKKPFFWFADGNVVLSDFRYRKIPFRYFATKFLLDSGKKLALSGTVLETSDGKALLNGLYEEKRGNGNSGDFLSGDGRLVFELESTMNGNDILRCLYPQWKSDFLNFPHPVKVDASGVIDYKDDGATVFTATVNNGKCLWKSAPITNVDCTMHYANEVLSIPRAVGQTCGGSIAVNYHFDFNKKREKGAIRLELKNAEFARVMKGMGAELKQLKGVKANCSGEMKASVTLDKKENLLLFGKGSADIAGEDMWHIPVLGELLKILGKAWHTQALGTITKFDMAFSLEGTTFRIDRGSSNGSVVAIRTDGSYDWATKDVDFRIRSELLKGTLPFAAMSKVLSPVSWILQKRIRGKGDELKWGE